METFELVVKVVTACSSLGDPPRVSAEVSANKWTLRIEGQSVVYRGDTLSAACDELLRHWSDAARFRMAELQQMHEWLGVLSARQAKDPKE